MMLRALYCLVVPRARRSSPLLLLLLTAACSRGKFAGEETRPDTAPRVADGDKTGGPPPAVKHPDVGFRWRSDTGSLSGEIETTMPTGETFRGRFHEITRTTQVAEINDFYSTWYGDPWIGPSWYWGDMWPYYGTPEEYLTSYTGRVVATLTSPSGARMRCRFNLDDPDRGMKGGGTGECQLSTGERITATIPPG